MANVSEVGAAKVEVESFQCSIKKITASTDWKAPDQEVDEEVVTTVYDNDSKVGKDIYIVTSPKGKKVTIQTERDDGKCQRQPHKEYKMSWDDYTKEEGDNANKEGKKNEDNSQTTSYSTRTENEFNAKGLALAAGKDAMLSIPIMPFLVPYNLIKTPIILKKEVKNKDSFKIKCFEIGGAWEALKYWRLPIPIDNKYVTKFSHISCKEGIVNYQIISYPDISFKIEVAFGSKEVKDKDADSKLKVEAKTIKEVPSQLKELAFNALETEFEFNLLPAITASTIYNGKQSELEFKLDTAAIKQLIDKKKKKGDEKEDTIELLHFTYKDHGNKMEFSSEALQEYPETIKKVVAFVDLIKNVCNLEFLKKFLGLAKSAKSELIENFKPYKLEFDPPGISISLEGKYHTSKDLTKIGKYYAIDVSVDPLICITLTVDLLFLLISAFSAGTATGIYVILKNLGSLLKTVLGDDYKEEYKENLPFSGKIYIDFVVKGKISSSFQYIIDTIKEDGDRRNYSLTPIDAELKVDLKAGAKVSIKIFYLLNASGELSGSASSGIRLIIGFEDHIREGNGIVLPYETIFNGLKVKLIVRGSVGLKKIFSWEKEKKFEKTLMEKTRIEWFSGEMTLLKEKTQKKALNESRANAANQGKARRT